MNCRGWGLEVNFEGKLGKDEQGTCPIKPAVATVDFRD